MKKILSIIKKDLRGFIIGVILCSITIVLAESIQSSEVLYDNSNSPTSYDNVQDVLDDMYSIFDSVGSGYELIAHIPEGLSTELVSGLYRYQGTNVNNYICFGTTDKETCTGDTDKYMYRIIGINSIGQMKLIKRDLLNHYSWHHINENIQWPNSDLFAGLNGEYFLENTNYVPSGWAERILLTDWHYGNLSDINVSADSLANTELGFNNTINAKVSLMYLHDYYYGLPGGNNCSNSGNYTSCLTSWIHLSASGNYSHEWTMARNNNGIPWRILYTGFVTNEGSNYAQLEYAVRPVFFLRASETIASGSGTITDPYILS